MTGGRGRRLRGTRAAVASSFVVAAVAHAALAGVATATGVLGGFAFSAAPTPARAATAARRTPLSPSCDGDALLAVGARSVLCVSPFVDDRAACVTELANRLESDRIKCHLEQLATEVALVPVDARTLPQITPEMLLDDLTPPPPTPPPPPPPELTVTPQQQPPPPPPTPAQKREDQIVEVAKPTESQPPPDTRLVAEYDTRVDHQTVARGAVDEPMIAKPSPAELAIKPEARDPSSSKPPDVEGRRDDAPREPGKLSMRTPGPRKPSELAQDAKTVGALDGALGPRGDGDRLARGNALFAAEARERGPEPGDEGGGGGTDAIPDLRPSQDVLERVAGGGSVDHLDDVEAGDETALNARGSVYASFFNRMKRRVAQVWAPGPLWQRHDPNLNVYGFKDRVTRVRVTLSPAGDLLKLIVVEPSGVDFLDDEALRAFRASQPFPNPPAGLVDSSGNIVFTFGFHVSLSGNRTSWRFFRE